MLMPGARLYGLVPGIAVVSQIFLYCLFFRSYLGCLQGGGDNPSFRSRSVATPLPPAPYSRTPMLLLTLTSVKYDAVSYGLSLFFCIFVH